MTLARAEGYLRRLSGQTRGALPLSQLVLGCVILADKYGNDFASAKGRWDPLLEAASPTQGKQGPRLSLWTLEMRVLALLKHNLSD